MSQREVALALGEHGLQLDPSAVTRIESGIRPVKVEEAVLLARVLGTRVSTLLAEDAIDPAVEIATLRRSADEDMVEIRHRTASWLWRLGRVQSLLRENPDLVGYITDADGHPALTSADDYLDWVRRRIEAIGVLPPRPVDTAEDAARLEAIRRTVASQVVLEARDGSTPIGAAPAGVDNRQRS